MKIFSARVLFSPLLATSLLLGAISAGHAQMCQAGAPLFTNCYCPANSHQAGTNGVTMSQVGCGATCPICINDGLNDRQRRKTDDDSQ